MGITSQLIWAQGRDRQISTHIMHMEIYSDTAEFCQGEPYRQWLDRWSPPPGAGVDHWLDHEQQQHRQLTPRRALQESWATRLPIYLLESLQIGQLACVDVGCGHNWFRRFHPTIWGVDPLNAQHRDDELTPEWWIPNWGRWPRAFSICSLHFCTQEQLPHQVAKFRGLLAPGGRGLLMINRARISDRTPNYQEHLLRDQLALTPGLTRMVWLDGPRDAALDGNLWLWLAA